MHYKFPTLYPLELTTPYELSTLSTVVNSKHMKPVFIAKFLFLSLMVSAQKKEMLTVNFEFNKSELTPEATAKLQGFITKIVTHPVASLQLSGYCDSKGSNAYNDALSLKRVKTVRHYLEKNASIDATLLKENAFGENNLLNEDSTDGAGFQNRRVELIALIKEQSAPELKMETKNLTTILEDTLLRKGAIISIPNLAFENNSDMVLSRSMPTLQELFDIMVRNPALKIAIEGHICCVMQVPDVPLEKSASFEISVLRAKKVYTFLIEKGIKQDRMSFAAFGSSRPIYPIPEKNEAEITANRRVEIRIIEK